MTKEEFHQRLKDLGINKKEFAEIAGVPYPTVGNWGSSRGDAKVIEIPNWVEPMLKYYEKAKKFDLLKAEICSKLN